MVYDLLKNRSIKKILTSRGFIFLLRLVVVLFFILVIAAGLWGGPARNIASVLTGVIWLTAISWLVLFFGKVWCLVCPWNTIAEWVRHKGFFVPKSNPPGTRINPFIFSLDLQWPGWLKKTSLPVLFLIGLVLIEYTFGIINNPRMIAYLALLLLVAAIMAAVIFQRKSFCRYVCPIGVISGFYARLAPLALRSKDRKQCERCRSKDCLKGNDRGQGCPVFEYPGGMTTNAHCILCLECLHTCPADNLTLNVRSFGGDISPPEDGSVLRHDRVVTETVPPDEPARAREAFFIILICGLVTFHSFFTGALGLRVTEILTGQTGWSARMIAAGLVLAVVFLGWLVFAILKKLKTFSSATSNYIYAFLPIALFYNLAMTLKYFWLRVDEVIPALLDPFGWNWAFWGTFVTESRDSPSGQVIRAEFWSHELIGAGQIILMTIGTVWALAFVWRAARANRFKKLVLMVLVLLLWYILNIWLVRF